MRAAIVDDSFAGDMRLFDRVGQGVEEDRR